MGEDVASAKIAELVLTMALMLGNKWLEDNTFTTHTWHDVTSLPQTHLKTLETAALSVFGFSLIVKDNEWQEWLNVLRSYTSQQVAHEPIGVIGSANLVALGRLDSLIGQASANGAIGDTEVALRSSSPMHTYVEEDDVVLYSVMANPIAVENRVSVAAPVSCHSRTGSMSVNCGAERTFSGLESNRETQQSSRLPNGHDIFTSSSIEFHTRRTSLALPQVHPPEDRFTAHQGYSSFYGESALAMIDSSVDVYGHFQPSNKTQRIPERLPRIRDASTDLAFPAWYRWEEVQAEMLAREQEQELLVRAWPRPSRLGWSGFTSGAVASAVRV